MGYHKILVTLDGSKLAEQALKHVLEVAAPKAHIMLLSVMAQDYASEVAALSNAANRSLRLPTEQWPVIPAIGDVHDANARPDYLQKAADWLDDMEYSVATEVRTGEPISTILEVASKGYDLIIMATHNYTGLERTVLGSVTAGVLMKATCPVLVVSPLNG